MPLWLTVLSLLAVGIVAFFLGYVHDTRQTLTAVIHELQEAGMIEYGEDIE